MNLSIGFSPCPNDTFMFDAMIHHKIDTEGIELDLHMADVEELNKKAFNKELDITKLSYHAFAYLQKDYTLLNTGSALGNNCGPLLIAKQELTDTQINHAKIAIPGKYTTANFLLSLAYPLATQKKEMLFSDIENAVLAEEVDAGLIIHENRFTYQEKGLVKILDLGEFWENNTKLPIPLGGIVIRKNIPKEIQQKVQRVLKRSIQFAFDNRESALQFVSKYAQEMEQEVMYQHIDLYVNEYSLNLGEKGKKAVYTLFEKAAERNLIPRFEGDIFV